MARTKTSNAGNAAMATREIDPFYQLGLRHGADASKPVERIEAHKWFNIAAMHGNEDAARMRREIAEEMSSFEIATAQRAAREWLTLH